MKKSNPQSALPVLLVAALIMTFGGGRLAAIGDRIGAKLADGSNSQAAGTEDNTADYQDAISCDWENGMAHKMHWPQLPDLGSSGMDVDMTLLFLADDFECMATGPINDVHIWGSFRGDVLPPDGPSSLVFEISIYSDIPAEVNSWSMPGELLWSRIFGPGEYSARKVNDSPEDWYDPAKELYLPNNHTQTYQYNFCIEEEPFIQEQGRVYWLSVKELAPDDAYYKFGWKTTTYQLRWNDDAVFFLSGKLFSFPLEYPNEHEYKGESIDLAFVITGSSEEGQEEYDWGDAPDGTFAPGYPTLAFTNGANHVITGPWLGDDYDQPDGESDGQPDTNALGDNNNGNDDENGVTIPTLIRGETADITLDVRGGGGVVQAWIDFNGDMTWQATEEIFNAFLPNGAHTISYSVPTSAMLGQTFARFRISNQGGLAPEGPALDGEVEDHEVFVEEAPKDTKWVQWPDLTPNGIDIRVDRNDGEYRIIADDFECISNNLITDIHLWGSWKYDNKGEITYIHLSILSDDPTGAGGQEPDNQFSKPDELLWGRYFYPNEFQETLYHVVRNPGEWWWDPITGEYSPGGDSEVWRIDMYIEPNEAFLQQGSPDNPVIYWLRVLVRTEDGEFGWKTRQWPDHYMDDAVWGWWDDTSKLSEWRELRYPETHPYHDLEKNSIDMAFQLTYTGEGPEYTSRPVSATQCPVAQTQCPAVATQCPPVQTQCPAVQTQCPAVQTQCPAVQTQCPAVQTQCPAVQTQCPAVDTECPPEPTKCSGTAETKCPPVETKCPAVDTACPPAETKCPPAPTKCTGTAETKCPPVETKCPAVETACPPAETKCPPEPTMCPPTLSKCPAVPTQCTAVDTRCPPLETKCPTLDTQCPAVDTKCPSEPTVCPAVTTQCPLVQTQCPITLTHMTQCPAVPTRCPPEDTRCPATDTQCPVEDTKCPATVTECRAVETKCPVTLTQCRQVETECPATLTKCRTEDTQCPTVSTKCPLTETRCPESLTECPAIKTRCPVVDTRCPSYDTECPPYDTECPPYDTECPTVSTQCPPTHTRCPIEKTVCPESSTNCPMVVTQCPAPLTNCQREPTVCPPVDTECPADDPTKCPAYPTKCYVEPTFCPVETQCPVTESVCRLCILTQFPIETRCPEEQTACPPVETECPSVRTKCPPLVTQCVFVPTQCPVVTQCPLEQTVCPPPSPGTLCLIVTQFPVCGFITSGPTCGFLPGATKSAPYVRQCPTIDAQAPTVITKPIAKAF